MKITKSYLKEIIKEAIEEADGVRSKSGDPKIPYYGVFKIEGTVYHLNGYYQDYSSAKQKLDILKKTDKAIYKIYKVSVPEQEQT